MCTPTGRAEDHPFGDDVAVFKVDRTVSALVALAGGPGSVSLRCDPDWALELRAVHEAVRPGDHLNTRHWNTSSSTAPPTTSFERRLTSYELSTSTDALRRLVEGATVIEPRARPPRRLPPATCRPRPHTR